MNSSTADFVCFMKTDDRSMQRSRVYHSDMEDRGHWENGASFGNGCKKGKQTGVGAWEFGGVLEFGVEARKQRVILQSPNEHLNKTQYE